MDMMRQLKLFSPDLPEGSGGAEATEPPLARLRALAYLILETNQHLNLTADREPELFWTRHIEDSLAAAARIESAIGHPGAGWTILDVGSGGGVPGLVWAILWPAARVDLLETRGKRAAFLGEAARALDLPNVQILGDRAEQLGQDPARRESYRLVTARALAKLPTMLELTLPFVAIGGWLAAIQSSAITSELTAAGPAIELLGGDPAPRVEPYTRSDGKDCAVCLVRKIRATSPQYPRRPNLPERRPLF